MKQRTTVTIYSVYDPDYNGKLELVSCEAIERKTTYYVPSHPSWLGSRTIFDRPNRHFYFSPEAAVTAHVKGCQNRVAHSREELGEREAALKRAEAFYISYMKRNIQPTRTGRRKR